MTNLELASLFDELADIMEIAGENHFKIRSYRNASGAISHSQDRIAEMPFEKLVSITSIGKAIAEKIGAAGRTGTFPALERWRQSEYSTLRPLLRIPGFTMRKLRILMKDFGISSIIDLQKLKADEEYKAYSKLDTETRERIIWMATTPSALNPKS